jgi:hypothetical protein
VLIYGSSSIAGEPFYLDCVGGRGQRDGVYGEAGVGERMCIAGVYRGLSAVIGVRGDSRRGSVFVNRTVDGVCGIDWTVCRHW